MFLYTSNVSAWHDFSLKEREPQGNPKQLLSLVADYIIVYAAPIWAGPKSPVHGALRIAFELCLMMQSVCIIAGEISLDLLADERNQLYNVKGARLTSVEKAADRLLTIGRWQQR